MGLWYARILCISVKSFKGVHGNRRKERLCGEWPPDSELSAMELDCGPAEFFFPEAQAEIPAAGLKEADDRKPGD